MKKILIILIIVSLAIISLFFYTTSKYIVNRKDIFENQINNVESKLKEYENIDIVIGYGEDIQSINEIIEEVKKLESNFTTDYDLGKTQEYIQDKRVIEKEIKSIEKKVEEKIDKDYKSITLKLEKVKKEYKTLKNKHFEDVIVQAKYDYVNEILKKYNLEGKIKLIFEDYSKLSQKDNISYKVKYEFLLSIQENLGIQDVVNLHHKEEDQEKVAEILKVYDEVISVFDNMVEYEGVVVGFSDDMGILYINNENDSIVVDDNTTYCTSEFGFCKYTLGNLYVDENGNYNFIYTFSSENFTTFTVKKLVMNSQGKIIQNNEYEYYYCPSGCLGMYNSSYAVYIGEDLYEVNLVGDYTFGTYSVTLNELDDELNVINTISVSNDSHKTPEQIYGTSSYILKNEENFEIYLGYSVSNGDKFFEHYVVDSELNEVLLDEEVSQEEFEKHKNNENNIEDDRFQKIEVEQDIKDEN